MELQRTGVIQEGPKLVQKTTAQDVNGGLDLRFLDTLESS
jgi:hypothetical protein